MDAQTNVDGMVTNLPADQVADLLPQTGETPAETPAEPKAEEPKTQETGPQGPKEESPQEKPQEDRPQKAMPIAKYINEKKEWRSERDQLMAKVQELEAKTAPKTQEEGDVDISKFAEEHGLDAALVEGIVSLARKGLKVPKEIQQIIEEREQEKQVQAETTAFNTRLDKLAKTFPNEPLADPKVKDKLLSLAYSTDKASDGEAYHQKELAELYFGYVKPEVEPGKPSAESSSTVSTRNTEVLDFKEIDEDETKLEKFLATATDEEMNKFMAWQREHHKTPITPPPRM